jgi:hypothetical protein
MRNCGPPSLRQLQRNEIRQVSIFLHFVLTLFSDHLPIVTTSTSSTSSLHGNKADYGEAQRDKVSPESIASRFLFLSLQ